MYVGISELCCERNELNEATQHLWRSTLVEPLSERELEVLKLLASELSGPQIARRLMVSLSTLRTHTQEHLRQAWGEQPAGGRAPGAGAWVVFAGRLRSNACTVL